MKVLIVFNHPAPYKVSIFNELAKYCDLTVLFERTKARNRLDDFYIKNKYDFKVIFLKDSYIGNEGTFSNKVRKYIKNHHNEYDQIVMNGYSQIAEIKAILYMQKHKINYSLLINGGVIHNKEPHFKKMFKTKMISGASYYMSPSKKSNEYLIYYGANKERIFNYPYSNFSEAEIISELPNKEEIRNKYSLPLDKKIFINASQFIDRKNNLQLLSIFKDRDDVLVLIGDGPELSKILQYKKENNMKNLIIRPFMKKDSLFELMKACDVFVTLAKEDIFGHTTLEALANGLPVVSSDKVNSSIEYITNGKNGYLVSLENNKEIDDCLTKSLKLSCKNAILSIKSNTFESSGKTLYDIIRKENRHE